MNAHSFMVPKFWFALLIIGLVFWRAPAAQNAPAATSLYAGWQEVAGSATLGGISNSGVNANFPALAFDPEERPVVAWVGDDGNNADIFLKRLEGSTWVGIGGSATGGGISNTEGDSSYTSLAIGANGEPVVAWSETLSDGNLEIFVKHWNGSAWVGMSGAAAGDNISETAGESVLPVLAVDHQGRPIAAWSENNSGFKIYLRRWNGSVWEGLAGSAGGGGISTGSVRALSPSLAINSLGNPVVAWEEQTPDGNVDIYLKRWNGSAWEEMGDSATGGGISLNVGLSLRPSLAITTGGEIAVAWEDDSGPGDDYDIYVKRWNGLNWVAMGAHSDSGGGISDNLGPSYWPSLATTPEGSWVVAWQDAGEDDAAIYFRMWNGSSWQELEAGSATGGGVSGIVDGFQSQRPSLATTPDGAMMVAWVWAGLTNSEIFARQYQLQTYGDWQPIGGSAEGNGISLNDSGQTTLPSLAFAPDGKPFVTWSNNLGGGLNDIYLRAWNNSHWAEIGGSATLGGVSATPGGSTQPSLAIDAGGLPVVAWREATAEDLEIYLKRWTGSAWEGMGGSAAGGGLSNTAGSSDNPWLAIDHEGRPVVAWVETTTNREIYLARWNGSAWAALGNSTSGGGISNSPGDSFRPTVAIDVAGNPVVAWADVDINSGNSEIYVKRWNGTAWVEMGSGSASGGGVSATPGGSFRPSLAINAAGVAAVAWEDNSGGGDYEIYARRYDPATASWKPIGSGSAEGGGVSNNFGDSTWPSLVLDADGLPLVAWQDNSNGWPQVYFRRFDGASWIETGPKSAQSGGVSGGPAGARAGQPSLAIDAGGRLMAAWEMEFSADHSSIYARAYTLCFPLTLSHTGQGQALVAAPTESLDCAPGEYKAGEEITLTAAPASGWLIAGWSGTDDDGSHDATNTLSMPGQSHTASVRYDLTGYRLFLPSVLDMNPD